MTAPSGEDGSTGRKLMWFAGLWLVGVGTLAVIGYGIRYWLGL